MTPRIDRVQERVRLSGDFRSEHVDQVREFVYYAAPPISGQGCRRNASGRKNSRMGKKDGNGNESKRSTRTRSVGGRIVLEQSDPPATEETFERDGGSTAAHFGRGRHSGDKELAQHVEGPSRACRSLLRRRCNFRSCERHAGRKGAGIHRRLCLGRRREPGWPEQTGTSPGRCCRGSPT